MELVFIFICKYMRTFLDNVGEVRKGANCPFGELEICVHNTNNNNNLLEKKWII